MPYLRSLAAGVILVVAVSVLLSACSSTEETTDTMDAEKWREDLRFLEENLAGRHVEPFRVVSEEDFHAAFADLDARIPNLSDAAIKVEMSRLVASIGDGHTELDLLGAGIGFRRLPLNLYLYGEDLIVRATTEGMTRALGARVEAVAGTPVEDVVDALTALISRDNDMGLTHSTPLLLVVPEILFGLGLIDSSGAATFTFQKNSERFDLELTALTDDEHLNATWVRARDGSPTPLHYENQDRWYSFAYLEDHKTMYVRLDRSEDQRGQSTIDKFVRELFGTFDSNRVDRCVLDVRKNGGGDNARNEPIIAGIEERKGQLKGGKIFVITGRKTFSAGLNAALDMKERCGAIIVGEPGRGDPNRGNSYISLITPNSNIRVDYADRIEGRRFIYKNPLPVDVAVTNRFEDYRRGRDRVLDAVLKR